MPDSGKIPGVHQQKDLSLFLGSRLSSQFIIRASSWISMKIDHQNHALNIAGLRYQLHSSFLFFSGLIVIAIATILDRQSTGFELK